MDKLQYISMVNFKISLVENQCLPFRSSHSQMFLKVVVLKSYAIFAGKLQRWSLFLISGIFPVLQACNFIKRKLRQRCSAVNIAKLFRTLPVAASALYHYFSKLLLKRPFNYSKQRPCS